MIIVLLLAAGGILSGSDGPPGTTNQYKNVNLHDYDCYGCVLVDQVVSVEEDFFIICNINQWPPVIGKEVPVRIANLESPSIDQLGKKTIQVQEIKSQTIEFIRSSVEQGKTIILENITRGDKFCLVADVKIDGSGIAEKLIDAGLARPAVKVVIEKVPAVSRHQDYQSPPAGNKNYNTPAVTANKTSPTRNNGQNNDNFVVCSRTSRIYHKPGCHFTKRISEENMVRYSSAQEAEKAGKRPCKMCNK